MFRLLSPLHLLHLLLLALSIRAQWVTETDIDDNGNTVVDRVSYDGNGNPQSTRLLAYLTGTSTATTTTTTTAPPRIVGQPNSDTGVATIVFQYTSDSLVYTATFSPSYQSPSPTPTPPSGTIISPADWTYTKVAGVSSGAEAQRAVDALRAYAKAWGGIVAVLAMCALVGARAVL